MCVLFRNWLHKPYINKFFPQLVAGPIERARVLLPQLTSPRRIRSDQFEEGCWLILSGYYLKCVVADNLAPFVEHVFLTPESTSGFEIIIGVWAAAFQIYGDFSGYSRIAIGVAKLMGIDLMTNFRRPYFAISPSDFWSRWHISLSSWLRDYLYIPLGGNRGSLFATYRNLMLTMLLGGLWHGAAWNFVAWGVFQGGVLCVWRFASEARGAASVSVTDARGWMFLLKVVCFFQVTCFGWVLFFVKHLQDVPLLLVNCFSQWQWNGTVGLATLVLFAGPVMVLELCAELKRCDHLVFEWARPVRLMVYGAAALAIALCGVAESREFIYFQF